MNLNLTDLLARTDLENKECVQKFLEGQGFTTYIALQNLPGRYGLPWLCGNGTNMVVIKLNEAIKEAAESVPTIEEAIKVAAVEPEPERELLRGDTPITDLEIEGVSKRQLTSIYESGVETLGELFDNKNSLEEVPGIGAATKDRILQAVTEALEKK